MYRLTLTKSPLKVSRTAFVSPCKWGYQKANKMRRGGGARADHQPREEEKKKEGRSETKLNQNLLYFLDPCERKGKKILKKKGRRKGKEIKEGKEINVMCAPCRSGRWKGNVSVRSSHFSRANPTTRRTFLVFSRRFHLALRASFYSLFLLRST